MPTEEFTPDSRPEIEETPPLESESAPAPQSGDAVVAKTPYGPATGTRHPSADARQASTDDESPVSPATATPAESASTDESPASAAAVVPPADRSTVGPPDSAEDAPALPVSQSPASPSPSGADTPSAASPAPADSTQSARSAPDVASPAQVEDASAGGPDLSTPPSAPSPQPRETAGDEGPESPSQPAEPAEPAAFPPAAARAEDAPAPEPSQLTAPDLSTPPSAPSPQPRNAAVEADPSMPVKASSPSWARNASTTGPTPLTAASAPRAQRSVGSRRRLTAWVAAAAFVLLGVVGVGGYAYAAHYQDIAVPGTTIGGIDVTGMNRDDIVTAINDRIGNATVTISGDANATATLADLGTTVDAEATADAALARGEGVADRFTALVSNGNVPVITTTDEAAVISYAASLIPSDRAVARNASIALNGTGTGFEVTSGAEGTAVDSDALKSAAASAAASLSPASVSVAFETKSPSVSDAEAQTVADEANGWIAQDVTVTDPDGEAYTAGSATKASWITVTPSDTSAPSISVDTDKVSEWVSAQADDVNEDPVNGKRNVNSNGDVMATPVEAVDGREVTNTDSITTAVVQAFSSDQSYSGSYETKTIKATWEDRPVAAGAENLPYQAAEGEKWIDINLSDKTVTAYEGATLVHGPVSVVDGAGATPTVTGIYHVYQQYESQTMRGDNADGSSYETEGVPWISYFHLGYALHGAPWRSSFGYSASHGCLNMPVDEAHWFYDWADIGTIVDSHN